MSKQFLKGTLLFLFLALTIPSKAQPPEPPAAPNPANEATDVPTTVTLNWTAPGATAYDVYLSKGEITTATEPVAVDLTVPEFRPPVSLQFERIYNWQILAKNGTGSTLGPIWSFLTADVGGVRDLVTHFYVVVLGRDPEAGAVDAWESGYFDAAVRDHIDVRFVFREMGRLFFLSSEYDGRERSNADFIRDSYEAFLLRTPSAGELQPWLDDVTTPSGEVRWNRAEVMTQFAESDEFENLIIDVFSDAKYRGDPARNFTTTMFIGVFDRISDTGGLEYFSGRMAAAKDKLAEAKKIALEFFLSEEGMNKAPTNEQKVIRLYRAFLGRFPADSETAFWTGELDSERETLESLIEKFGDSEEFAGILARYFDGAPNELTVTLPGDVPLVLVRITSGSFQMGSPDTEQGRDGSEGPVHTVTIGYDFYMGKCELTKRQWQAVMGTTPWLGKDYVLSDLDSPAVYVSWNDAQSFLTALNAHIASTGQGPTTLRLPSESEWEYICRAGTQTRFYWGDDPSYTQIGDYAWYDADKDGAWEHVVGRKLPNAWGLYDMSGNVWEWCQDDWHMNYSGAPTDGSAWGDGSASSRLIRGGYWTGSARYCRSAYRYYYAPSITDGIVGFRVATSAFGESPNGVISIDTTPDTGSWALAGPVGFEGNGQTFIGDKTFTAAPVGEYVLTCDDNVSGYDPPASEVGTLVAGGNLLLTATWTPEGSAGEERTITLPGNVPLVLVPIPSGSFQMGSPDTEQDRSSAEGPVHTVHIGYDFYLGKYEITKRQWQAVMGTTPWSGWSYVLDDPDSPAVYVSWNNAQSFVTALNAHITATGQGSATLRLPSEAEWEYACRAGTTTRFYWGDDPSYTIGDYAWYWENREGSYAHVVGRKLPNAWGLYDMSGNVYEWCQDDWHSNYNGAPTDGSAWGDGSASSRVLRGGSWINSVRSCRSAGRGYGDPSDTDGGHAFRLATVR